NKLNYRPIDRGDILVFHFPEGDTVIDKPEFRSLRPYYEVIRLMRPSSKCFSPGKPGKKC
ncbi:MAG TPA: hypothetical protein VL978_16585, partial [Puia sp.]|nr:hypothetical protein [Puia sp.]